MSIDHRTLLGEHLSSVDDKLRDLQAKRDTLKQRLLETVTVEAAAFIRTDPTPAEIVDWVERAATLARVTGLRPAALAGLGISVDRYRKMRWVHNRCWASGQRHGGGLCHADPDTLWPRIGPTVYALRDVDGTIVYIGLTQDFRTRLISHNYTKRDAIHSWEAWACDTEAEMRDLEAILIDQHRPRLNKRVETRNGAAA